MLVLACLQQTLLFFVSAILIITSSSQVLGAKIWISAGFQMMSTDQDAVPWFADTCSMHVCCVWVCVCVCPTHIPLSPMLSHLTLFNLQSHQIWAKNELPSDVSASACHRLHCQMFTMAYALLCLNCPMPISTMFTPIPLFLGYLIILLCFNNIFGIHCWYEAIKSLYFIEWCDVFFRGFPARF